VFLQFSFSNYNRIPSAINQPTGENRLTGELRGWQIFCSNIERFPELRADLKVQYALSKNGYLQRRVNAWWEDLKEKLNERPGTLMLANLMRGK
jgi:hypothetical protein